VNFISLCSFSTAGRTTRSSYPGSCTSNFPDCWDGKTLVYANQKNTAYSVNGRCPKGYPVAMPALQLVFRYPAKLPSGRIELASGGQYSGHADVVNTWDQKALTTLVAGYLNKYRHCGTGS